VIAHQEIHKVDEILNESIISTLKYFQLHIDLREQGTGELAFDHDGMTLVASLVYEEDGLPVEDVSATFEPPLLGDGGTCPPKAVIEGGCAMFKLRITVLSSLCQKRSFKVQVASEDQPSLVVLSDAVKTITKLKRTARPSAARRASTDDESACSSKRPFAQVGDDFVCSLHELSKYCDMDEEEMEEHGTLECLGAGEAMSAVGTHTIDELWDEVATNGSRLLELQAQQRRLFKELRVLRAACGLDRA